MQLVRVALRALAVVALVAAPAVGLNVRRRQFDCPLCVAEDNCHEACAQVRGVSPGSEYCLTACTGAHPMQTFGESYFKAADMKMKKSAELDARIHELGQELAADIGTVQSQ